MQKIIVKRSNVSGTIDIPGDKSISHRAVMIASIAKGRSVIKGLLNSEDVENTVRAFRQMGVKITGVRGKGAGYREIQIHGKGLYLKKPKKAINCGNSGTTMRLISGILAGQDFASKLTGNASLTKRPMARIIMPLQKMGAAIKAGSKNYPPFLIQGSDLRQLPSPHKMQIASAQVKSCLLLAHLYTKGKFRIIEPALCRDHTERMLKFLGARIEKKGLATTLISPSRLKGRSIEIPKDISSAGFFLVLGAIARSGRITMKHVGINPTRNAIIDVLKKMGARITVKNKRVSCEEPVADISVEPSRLKGISIKGKVIPVIIDELPILAIAATQAKGRTIIRDASELRVKETDRIRSMVTGLKKMGARIKELKDGMVIDGPVKLKGASIKSYGDHRTAMSFVVAGLVSQGNTVINDTQCIDTSFPGFINIIKKCGASVKAVG